MGLIPDDSKYKLMDNVGQLDLSIPDTLLDREDQAHWHYYASCLPPAKLVSKFNEAVDDLIQISTANNDAGSLTKKQTEDILSKTIAADALITPILNRLYHDSPYAKPDRFDIDMDNAVSAIIALLKSTDSIQTQDWEQKKEDLKKLSFSIPDELRNIGEQERYSRYKKTLTPASLVTNFNDAVGELIEASYTNKAPSTLSSQEKQTFYSKWHDANELMMEVLDRFDYHKPSAPYDERNITLVQAMSLVIEFLESTQSKQTQDWKNRRDNLKKINFSPLLEACKAKI